MIDSMTKLLVEKLKNALDNLDEDFKAKLKANLNEFWDSGTEYDLYYASFAMILESALCNIVDVEFEFKNELDFVHKCSLARLYYIQKIKNDELLEDIARYRCQSVYDVFLKVGVLSDFGFKISKYVSAKELDVFQKEDGGFSNIIEAKFSSNNASSAGLSVKYFLGTQDVEKNIAYLLKAQDFSGGYFAQIGSEIPDLLTTATSIFALSLYNKKPNVDSIEFICAHSLDNGEFSATLKDDSGDLEYTFYGLLGLGCLC